MNSIIGYILIWSNLWILCISELTDFRINDVDERHLSNSELYDRISDVLLKVKLGYSLFSKNT